ncbi:MAG TPA: hypothetical protein VFA46_20870 [Actinomycetes bacterium]|nr:hypothetical protein [Actinomycetes bacterium]
MAAKPTRRKGWELFANPAHQNQRRYEALRAYLFEGAPPGPGRRPVRLHPRHAGIAGP